MNRKYTSNEKKDMVDRYLSGESVASIIEGACIPRSTIYSWIKRSKKATTKNNQPITLKKFNILKRKVERLNGIINILKTAPCTVSASLREKLVVIEELSDKHNVNMLCEALCVAKGTYYNHILRNKRENTVYAKRREELKIKIQEVYDENKQIFGAGKITAILNNKGCHTSVKTVSSIMCGMGISSIRTTAKATYLKMNKNKENILNQNFNATCPNQIWVSDVTYFKLNKKAFYICVIIDLFSRKVVAHKISTKNSTQLVKSTFKAAYEKRTPSDELLFHTDRGINYLSNTFCSYLKELKVKQSFSRVSMPYDNSVCESFFGGMKREELYRTKYRSENELKNGIDDYMIFYNEQRPHSKIRYKTPKQFEAEYTGKHSNLENK